MQNIFYVPMLCYTDNIIGNLINKVLDLNNKINCSWFNDSFNTFKVNCKKMLL